MKNGIIVKRKKPEAKIQEEIENFLRIRGWFVKRIHGSTFQTGLPDLYVCQRKYGSRWVEVKNPDHYKLEVSQIETFSRLSAEGVGVWILVAATDEEYQKLFSPPNWWTYLSHVNMNK